MTLKGATHYNYLIFNFTSKQSSLKKCTKPQVSGTDFNENIKSYFHRLSRAINLKKTKQKNKTKKKTLALTINPGYSNAFKECNPQKAHTTGCIIVKELKHIHATLRKREKNKAEFMSSPIKREKTEVEEGI